MYINHSLKRFFLFVLFAIVVASCKDDSPEIIGTWGCSTGDTEDCGEFSDSFDTECDGFQVTFLGDGTYTTRYELDDHVYENEGTYLISGDFLIFNLESGNESVDRIALSSSELQIITEQGQGCKLIWFYNRM